MLLNLYQMGLAYGQKPSTWIFTPELRPLRAQIRRWYENGSAISDAIFAYDLDAAILKLGSRHFAPRKG